MASDLWSQKAQALQINGQAFIGGQYSDAASSESFATVNPANGEVLAQVARCGEADVDRAVASAKAAMESRVWAGMEPRARKKVLLKAAALLEEHKEELALLETLDMGKPIKFTQFDIAGAIETFRYYGEAIDKVYGEMGPTGDNDLSMLVREPIGVVAAVVPWNFPLLMASWKIAPALAGGNSVVLKPAEQSPLTAIRIAGLLSEAGIPDGVFNVVPGFGEETGRPLGLHMDVNAVSFTGSTEVGKLFLQYSGQSNMKRVSLECGGKSPHIIMADCPDLDAAAEAAAAAIFYNQGEVCTAGSRLVVDREVQDAFMELLLKHARAWVPGDPLEPEVNFGPMVDESQMQRALTYIEKGQSEGAEVVMGGRRARLETGGYFVEPTIFKNVSNDHAIAQEEIFGPVLSVIPFSGAEEALKLANDSEFGLAAAVWSSNISTALRTARSLQSGLVWVNSWDACNIAIPFGGYKQSGIGRDRSVHALEKYTELKSIWVKL